MTDMSVKSLLTLAADLIAPEGHWTKGDWGKPSSRMCTEGAIYAAADSHPLVTITIGWGKARLACDFLVKHLPHASVPDKNPIADWNDAPERTQEEVVAKLREVATLAAKEIEPCS